jgi:hypothetical protein
MKAFTFLAEINPRILDLRAQQMSLQHFSVRAVIVPKMLGMGNL